MARHRDDGDRAAGAGQERGREPYGQPERQPYGEPGPEAYGEPERGPDSEPERGPGGEAGRAPDKPTDLSKRSWKGVLKKTVKEFKDDNLTDWAAALTYYGVLSIFPALLALVSILGLVGSSAIQPLIDNVSSMAPGSVRDLLTSMLEQLQNNQGRAGLALIIGIAVALWSASGYIAAFMRAGNAVYDIPEGRPVWKTIPTRLGITLVTVLLLALISIGVVFTGGLAQRAGDVLGVGDTALTVWGIAKWPVLVLLVSFVFSVLYWAAPNVKRKFRWVTLGGLVAVLVWLVASALFALYVANFSNYSATYGSLAGIIIFLVWLWVSNIAILLGLELNAELERGRAIEGGHPPEEEPYVEPRDTRKFED
ncbi:YihY family inner membrane protein [Streptomyces sp. JJ66]|uniref:YhjD/YihY/BrkB family envelope integrity protein n=1 Tax=Streptomyces sp. JJ66 TaxID=2803843 RepID=UPI001C5835B7|nr:YhjD/YihY/BrkB family envelope integrity protein [Streptomyces sp. JJ66]MBW1603643.1 YihY family inner membrane protein [Streptomyces sp. JJ66]